MAPPSAREAKQSACPLDCSAPLSDHACVMARNFFVYQGSESEVVARSYGKEHFRNRLSTRLLHFVKRPCVGHGEIFFRLSRKRKRSRSSLLRRAFADTERRKKSRHEEKGDCVSSQSPFKDGVQNAVHNICLNLHVQVGTLSPVFVLRSRRPNSRRIKSGSLL